MCVRLYQVCRMVAVIAALSAAACGPGQVGQLGDACTDHDDCGSAAQCFQDMCAPLCEDHASCGGGYLCEPDGTCVAVDSQIGDPCARELDCGPGQSCRLADTDGDSDGFLDAQCGAEATGAVTGGTCGADSDCRSGICALGRCSELCAAGDDCPFSLACVEVPRAGEGGSASMFRGCLQPAGRLEYLMHPGTTSSTLRVPVPSHARSFALVTSVRDPAQRVGVGSVVAPDGSVLYEMPADAEGYYDNPIRYAPGRGVSTLLVPNNPAVELMPGLYDVSVSGGTEIPEVRVVYRLGPPSAAVDFHFYFLDLSDHPCAEQLGDATTAAGAAASQQFQNAFLAQLASIFADAGIALGEVTYRDVVARPDLDAITRDELGPLLQLSEEDVGVNVFFVRSIDPVGIQAVAGGTPGTPFAGTRASGIAIGVDTLCYRSWQGLARQAAHTAAKQLGLFPNLDPAGHADPIADSPSTHDNLMFFSELGGTKLSNGQSSVLRGSAVLP